MAFFDLNIPYTESSKHNSPTAKSTRLKLVIKAIELGYSGVAYNRTITGVMSEVDRCSIALFPLSSVLKVSPSISTAVNLHRRVLNVSATAPFRQYTRLTVVVDSPAQGACLNCGNPVLKSYDIVAVRPLKQEVFDLACKNYEVDIIAIDFSETRFRLKQPLIKAAIERGVCFEITYSGLLDAQLRRQIISNAKLLVDWTRGKNIIFSSAAASVTEFRGPYDVANLACLLGFSMERAKASVSKTCRTLLENSIRKKKFFKEAIKAEIISSVDDGFDDWLKWDPISSGEGDLQLDDMAKSFAASNKESKMGNKAIDFVSVINELPSHGLQITDTITETKSDSKLYDLAKSFAASNKEPKTGNKAIDFVSVINELSPHGLQITDMITETKSDSKLYDPHEKDDLLEVGNCDVLSINENVETLASVEEGEACAMVIDEPEQQNMSLKVDEDIHEDHVIFEKESEDICSDVPKGVLVSFDDNPSSNIQFGEANKLSPIASMFPPMPASNEAEVLEEQTSDTKEACLPEKVLEEHMSDAKEACLPEKVLEEHMNDTKETCLPEEVLEEHTSDTKETYLPEKVLEEHMSETCLPEEVLEEHMSDTKDVAVIPVTSCLTSSVVSLNEKVLVENTSVTGENVSTAPASALATLGSHDELQINGCDSVVHEQSSSVVHEPSEDVSMEVNVEVKDDSCHLPAQESSSERVRRKHGGSRRPVSFPFKRLLEPSHFKKSLKMRRKNISMK